MATHSSILAWRIPWTEEPGGLQSVELQRVGCNLASNASKAPTLSFIFFKILFLLMWTILKVFIEFVTMLLLFYIFWFFGHRACGILVP